MLFSPIFPSMSEKGHALIVDAIADRDGELAELLMRRHIRASRRGVERRLAAEAKSQTEVTAP